MTKNRTFLCLLRTGKKSFTNPPPYFALFANHQTMNIRKNHKFHFGGILLTALLSIPDCEALGIGDTDLDRGHYTGNVTYSKYTYLKDSSEPKLDILVFNNQVRLQEDKKGLFIENNTVNYYFDNENNIEITTNEGYIKYKRTNNSIEMNTRTEITYADSTTVSLGNGTLEKQ